MTVYTNMKCPSCKSSFTGGYRVSSGWTSMLGVPFLRCPNCKTLLKTGKKPWSHLTVFEKILESIRKIVLTIWEGVLISILIVLLIAGIYFYILENTGDLPTEMAYASSVLGAVIAISRNIYLSKKYIPEIEKKTMEQDWDEPMMFF